MPVTVTLRPISSLRLSCFRAFVFHSALILGACVSRSGAGEAKVRFPEFLEQYAATYRFSLGRPASIQITRAGDAVLFLRSGPRSFVRRSL